MRFLSRRRAEADAHAAATGPSAASRAAPDARAERRDARPRGPDRPARRRAGFARWARRERARLGAGHAVGRRRAARRLRDRRRDAAGPARRAGRRADRAARARCSSAATSARWSTPGRQVRDGAARSTRRSAPAWCRARARRPARRAEVARATRWLAGETAGQCGPCVHGLAAIADGVGRLATGRADRLDRGAAGALGGAGRGPRRLPPPRRRGALRRAARCACSPTSSTTIAATARARRATARPCSGSSRRRSRSGGWRHEPRGCAWTRSPAPGHGLCAELFPEGIELDDWGYPDPRCRADVPEAASGTRGGPAAACPTLALRLRRERDGRR